MGLFDFKKNKEKISTGDNVEKSCSCSNTTTTTAEDGEHRFIVLGACCKKSADTFDNVKQAVAELGLKDQVVNIGDNIEIAKYGVMQTPAFVINKKVVSYGKLIKVEEAKKLIEKSGEYHEL